MKKLFLLFLLFLYQESSAQLVIDSLKTPVDVETFVKYYSKKHVWQWDTLQSQKWITEDFNNDGRQDMIWHGVFKYNSKGFFSLVSKGAIEYEYIDLQKSNMRYRPFDFEACKKENQTLLVIKSTKLEFRNKKEIKRENIDTLLYRNGGFIERQTKKHKSVDFDSLFFSSYATHLNPASFYPNYVSINIAKDKTIKYTETRYQLKFECVTELMEKEKVELNDLLSFIGILNMKDSFDINSLHSNEAKIKIVMGTQVKKIYDYGEEGNYGLMLLYKKLFAIVKRIRILAAQGFEENDFWDD